MVCEMNKPRRKQLEDIITKLDELKEALEVLQKEEEEYRDNIPENLQGSERYEKAEAACDNLYEAASSLDEALDYIRTATE